jgi:hypothetical protein
VSLSPRLQHVVELHDPTPLRVEFHDPCCPCHWCVEEEADAAAQRDLDTFVRAGKLAAWGIAIGSAIAFAIDAHGALLALAALAGAR